MAYSFNFNLGAGDSLFSNPNTQLPVDYHQQIANLTGQSVSPAGEAVTPNMGMQDYLRTQPGYEGFTKMLPGYSGMVWTGSSPVIDFGGYTSGGIPIYSTTPFNNYIENVPSSVFHPAGSDGFLDNTIGSALSKVDKQVTTTVGSINETIGPYIPAVGLTAGALIASAATEGLAAPYFAAALGPVWGGVATGAAAGAAGGAVSGLPSTHDGDWSGVAKGAIGGGLLGGAGAGVSAIGSGISQGLSPDLTAADLDSANFGDIMSNAGSPDTVPISAEQYDALYGGGDPSTFMGGLNSAYSDVMSSRALSAPLTKLEIGWVNNDNYMNSPGVQEAYETAQNHPGVKVGIEGPNVGDYSTQTPEDLYGGIRPAPANPGLSYPLADPKTGLPIYSADMYDYTINPDTGAREYSSFVNNGQVPFADADPGAMYGDPYGTLDQFNAKEGNWYDDWQTYLKYANKLLGPLLASESAGTPSIPGTTRPGGGGRGLDIPDFEALSREKKDSRASGLGMDMLEGSEFPLTNLYNPYLEDYIQPTRQR